MRSSDRDEVVEVLDALEADYKRALDLRCDALTTPEYLGLLQRCERIRRWLPAVEHPLINQLSAQASETELGGKLASALANRLRISRAEASRRIHEAATSASAGLWMASRWRRCFPPPPKRSATATSAPDMSP
jgi:Domain of unknown function (DUF222)